MIENATLIFCKILEVLNGTPNILNPRKRLLKYKSFTSGFPAYSHVEKNISCILNTEKGTLHKGRHSF